MILLKKIFITTGVFTLLLGVIMLLISPVVALGLFSGTIIGLLNFFLLFHGIKILTEKFSSKNTKKIFIKLWLAKLGLITIFCYFTLVILKLSILGIFVGITIVLITVGFEGLRLKNANRSA